VGAVDAFELPPLDGASQIAAGRNISCALSSEGSVLCWGDNENNQLGGGAPSLASATVVSSMGSGNTFLAAGGQVFAVGSDRAVKCPLRTIPGAVAPVLLVRSQSSLTCSVAEAGSAQCWIGGCDGTPNFEVALQGPAAGVVDVAP